MKRKDSNRHYCFKLAVILGLIFIGSGLLSQSVYAEENVQEAVTQEVVKPEGAANNTVITKGKISENIEKKILPTLTITLQDEDGNPITGINLAAVPADFNGQAKENAKTDENGKAIFTHLTSGNYYFYGNIKGIRKHSGYGIPTGITEFKSVSSYYISEVNSFDLSQNMEYTYTIKKSAYMWFSTFLDVFKPGKIVITNKKMGIQQIIPVAGVDYMQIYMPMRSTYQIVTIKDNDYDSWIIDFYVHERLHIELL